MKNKPKVQQVIFVSNEGQGKSEVGTDADESTDTLPKPKSSKTTKESIPKPSETAKETLPKLQVSNTTKESVPKVSKTTK